MAIEKDDAVNNVEEKMADVTAPSPSVARDEAKLGVKKNFTTLFTGSSCRVEENYLAHAQ